MSKYRMRTVCAIILLLVIIMGMPTLFMVMRFDMGNGTHRITPTAIDNDMFGNYKLYYRTSDYTNNRDEDFYYIERGNSEIADMARVAIIENCDIVVTYDKYVGFKGIGAPRSAPITDISYIDKSDRPIQLNEDE